MTQFPRALIKRSLADLVPRYMNNRRKDLELAVAAIAADDFVALKQIGHRLKGSGSGYGFHDLTTLGGKLEQAALRKDVEAIRCLVQGLDEYLKTVQIELV